MNEFLMGLVEFLGTYLIHSTVLIGGVILLQRLMHVSTGTLEVLYRTALVAPVLTAVLSINLAIQPLAGTVRWLEIGEVTAPPTEPPPPEVARAAPAPEAPVSTLDLFQSDAIKGSDAGRDVVPARPGPGPELVGRRVHFSLPTFLAWTAAAWLLVAGFLSLRWIRAARAGRRLLAGRRPLASGPAHGALLRLTSRQGVAVPALSVSDALGGPATLPSGEICVPGWAMELPADQVEAMLAHELAHVARRDSWWLAVALSLESLFWMQPFNQLVRRRLARLAELHADAWAAEITHDGRALARCLASCAERMSAGRMPALAAAMARRGGALSERVSILISNSTKTGEVPMFRKFVIFAGVVSLVMVLPSVAVLANKSQEMQDTSVNIHKSGEGARSMSLSFTGDDMKLKLRASGDFVFAPDASGLEHMGPGAELEVVHESDGLERKLLAEGMEDGIAYTFYVAGEERPYDAQARAWFADILPMVIRETAINAPERVDYLLEQGGHNAVLDEIAKIRSDFARRHYVEAFVATGELPDDALDRLIGEVSKIGSDFEMRNALGAIYETQKPRGDRLAELIVVAGSIGSDFELRQFLGSLAKDAIGDESVMTAYAQAAEGIGSDFELRQALGALMEAGSSPRAVVIALPVAKGISSDFEMRSLLEEAASAAVLDENASRVWLEAAGTIGSDFELRQALTEFANKQPPSVATWLALFETAKTIGSDHECSSFLVAAADHMPDDPAVEEAFRSVMQTIGSDSDYRRVARVLE